MLELVAGDVRRGEPAAQHDFVEYGPQVRWVASVEDLLPFKPVRD
jgi:hypothetical protein